MAGHKQLDATKMTNIIIDIIKQTNHRDFRFEENIRPVFQ